MYSSCAHDLWAHFLPSPLETSSIYHLCLLLFTFITESLNFKIQMHFHLLHQKIKESLFQNFQIYMLNLEKAEESETKLPASIESSKRQESSRKTSTFASLTTLEPLVMWITTNCGKVWKRWEYQTTWPASWETYLQFIRQQLELDMKERLVPNRKRSTSRLYIVTLLI